MPLAAPKRLTLELTSRCNLHCTMCGRHYRDPEGSPHPDVDMTEAYWQSVLALAPGLEQIIIGGAGEPLVCLDAVGRLGRLRAAAPKAYITLFTNGTKLADFSVAETVSQLVDVIHVSTDGWEHYEEVHTGANSGTFTAALANLADIQRNYVKTARIVLGFICMARNVSDAVQVARIVKLYGFERIVFKDLQVWNPALQAESLRHDESLAAQFREVFAQVQALGVAMQCEPFPEFNTAKTVPAATRPLPCSFPWEQVLVNANGDVRLCCFGNSRIGTLRTQTLDAIWTGEQAQAYRETMQSGAYLPACAHCRLTAFGQPGTYEKYKQ